MQQLVRRAVGADVPAPSNYVQLEKENGIGRRSYEALGFRVVREYADNMFGFQTIALEMCLEL